MRVLERAPGAWKMAGLPTLLFLILGSTALRLGIQPIAAGIGAAALVALVAGWRLRAASGWAFWITIALIAGLGLGQAYALIDARQSLFAILTLGVMALTVPAALYAYRENHRIFFRPGLRWYQGLPRTIPRVTAEWAEVADWEGVQFRVSGLNGDGAYLFASERPASAKPPGAGAVTFRFRDQVIPCNIKVMSSFDRGSSGFGLGVRFERKTLAEAQRLNDWIEKLRGEGYVD